MCEHCLAIISLAPPPSYPGKQNQMKYSFYTQLSEVRHGLKPDSHEAEVEAFTKLEAKAKALTLINLEAKALVTKLKPKPGYL